MKDVASGPLVATEEKQFDLGFVGLAVGAHVRIDFDDLRPLIETIAESGPRYMPNSGAVDNITVGREKRVRRWSPTTVPVLRSKTYHGD